MKVLRDFWNPAELRALAERVLFGNESRKVLLKGSDKLRDMVHWNRPDHPALWDACRSHLPPGDSHGGHVVIRYRTGVELKGHRDDGARRFVVLARAADQGGELVFEGETVHLLVGDAIVFDDSRLHEVTRVEAGERWTLTMGVWPK